MMGRMAGAQRAGTIFWTPSKPHSCIEYQVELTAVANIGEPGLAAATTSSAVCLSPSAAGVNCLTVRSTVATVAIQAWHFLVRISHCSAIFCCCRCKLSDLVFYSGVSGDPGLAVACDDVDTGYVDRTSLVDGSYGIWYLTNVMSSNPDSPTVIAPTGMVSRESGLKCVSNMSVTSCPTCSIALWMSVVPHDLHVSWTPAVWIASICWIGWSGVWYLTNLMSSKPDSPTVIVPTGMVSLHLVICDSMMITCQVTCSIAWRDVCQIIQCTSVVATYVLFLRMRYVLLLLHTVSRQHYCVCYLQCAHLRRHTHLWKRFLDR
jgi:hypothetical protein